MLESLRSFLDPSGFIPHGHCYLWKPELLWLHIVSDGAIAFSYFSIPITLLYFAAKRKDIPFNWIFLMFGAFILACGTGHIMNVWTLWHPNYWVSGLIKVITAIASIITALELIPLVPKALALPKPAELEETNRELEEALRKLQQTQIQLIQTEKMSSLGQLVAGIAHEINNPINFIHGNLSHADQYVNQILNLLQLYQQSYPEPNEEIQTELEANELDFLRQDLFKVLASMRVGTERIRRLVLTLRNFSRLDESEMKPVNLHEGIESTLLILQNRIKPKPDQPGIHIEKVYGQIPLITCYPGQLNQVFINLISNAIDALEERMKNEEASIKNEENSQLLTLHSQLPPPTIRIQTEVVDREWILVQISDNGPGMSEKVKQKMFNPFFTTKPIGKGTGLGLSISYQIVVDKHGGQFDCISTSAKGTTFQIKIPIQQQKAPAGEASLLPSFAV